MSDEQVARTIFQANKLDFVDEITLSEDRQYVLVRLSPRLTSVLPPAYGVLQIPRSEFTLEKVIIEFSIVAERLQYLADTAQEMLRSAKVQSKKKPGF